LKERRDGGEVDRWNDHARMAWLEGGECDNDERLCIYVQVNGVRGCWRARGFV